MDPRVRRRGKEAMRSKRRAFLCVLICGLVLSSCQREPLVSSGTSPAKKPMKQGSILAKVGNEIITVADFENELRTLPQYTRKRMNSVEEKKRHLDKMIDEMLLLQEAEKRGLSQNQELLAKVERYRNRLVTEMLYRDVAKERSQVDEAEIEAYFQTHKNRFAQKERIRVSQILILLPPDADSEKEAEARKKAEESLGRVRAGEDFGELAKEYSEGPTAERGGDLGYFSRGRMLPDFEEAAFSLEKVGDTSDLVRTKFGYHIIVLTGRQPAKELSLDEVRERIVRQLASAKRKEIRQSLAKELRESGRVNVYEERLEGNLPGEE
jgi:peptidyl-prolyl cis-trans isomerase C